jgi:hypothetical protein
MGEPLRKIASSRDHTVWMTQPNEVETIMKRRDIAFDVTKGKLAENGKIETAMQTAEAFGRGLFSDFIKNESTAWTMNTLIEPMTEHILNPMGTGATFTNIKEDEATSLIFRCRLHDEADEPHMASLFTYGFLRGMLRSAFPHGELLMGSSMAEGAPMIELTFKTRATDKDRWERERIKRLMIDAAKPEE